MSVVVKNETVGLGQPIWRNQFTLCFDSGKRVQVESMVA